MKKKWTVMIGMAILLGIIVAGGIKIRERIRIKNVFDEIYYSEIDYVKHHKAVGLPMMKQIKPIDHKHIQKFDELTIIIESYKKEYLKENEDLLFNFGYSNKNVSILYVHRLDKETALQLAFDYDVRKRIMRESIAISLGNTNKADPETKEEIQQYLDQYHITHEELQKKAHEILYDKVLKDWIESNDTRFSLKNIGDVKIEKDSFLTQS